MLIGELQIIENIAEFAGRKWTEEEKEQARKQFHRRKMGVIAAVTLPPALLGLGLWKFNKGVKAFDDDIAKGYEEIRTGHYDLNKKARETGVIIGELNKQGRQIGIETEEALNKGIRGMKNIKQVD